MNYNHLYHAGNFADVVKHCILILLIQFLSKKDKPFFYLDTHAGSGRYDLTSELAQKTHEYTRGIALLYNLPHQAASHTPTVAAVIDTYLAIVHATNQTTPTSSTNFPRYYPGSPTIAHALLRPQDRMLLVELHPDQVHSLKQEFAQDHRVAVHHTDGYQSIKALLPHHLRRGLILIDPPFEQKDEWQKIIDALHIAFQRFPTGIYAIWYPIKDAPGIKNFHRALKNIGFNNLVTTELSIDTATNARTILNENHRAPHLTSCGVAIINAPWQFEPQLQPLVAWLRETLSHPQ